MSSRLANLEMKPTIKKKKEKKKKYSLVVLSRSSFLSAMESEGKTDKVPSTMLLFTLVD